LTFFVRQVFFVFVSFFLYGETSLFFYSPVPLLDVFRGHYEPVFTLVSAPHLQNVGCFPPFFCLYLSRSSFFLVRSVFYLPFRPTVESLHPRLSQRCPALTCSPLIFSVPSPRNLCPPLYGIDVVLFPPESTFALVFFSTSSPARAGVAFSPIFHSSLISVFVTSGSRTGQHHRLSCLASRTLQKMFPFVCDCTARTSQVIMIYFFRKKVYSFPLVDGLPEGIAIGPTYSLFEYAGRCREVNLLLHFLFFLLGGFLRAPFHRDYTGRF